MTEPLCIVCAVRGRTPVPYEHASVCEPDRLWLAETLAEIARLCGDVRASIEPRRGGGQRLSGSREAPVPLVLDVVDLTWPARPASIGVRYRYPWRSDSTGDPDQIGHLSVATELEFWVQDWIAMRGLGEHLPPANAADLAAWLGEPVRLRWACDHNPAVDEFAGVLRRVRGALAAYVPRMVEKDDDLPYRAPEARTAPCPACDMVSLWWFPGDERVRCDTVGCDRVMTDDEYTTWSRQVLAYERRVRA